MMLGVGSWYTVSDGDPRLVALYERHYSANPAVSRAMRLRHGVSGVGESMCLLTVDCRAGFIWVRNTTERYDKQTGVQCSFFRREDGQRASDLIREASELAWLRWPGERLWTYVDPDEVGSSNPGYSFLCASWEKVGKSKGGLLILECFPNDAEIQDFGVFPPVAGAAKGLDILNAVTSANGQRNNMVSLERGLCSTSGTPVLVPSLEQLPLFSGEGVS